MICFFFSSRRRHTRWPRDWSSDVCSSDLEDVIELQSRLQYIGFYNGKIDGVFGWGTYWALRNFQYEFGLDIDGMAGERSEERRVGRECGCWRVAEAGKRT